MSGKGDAYTTVSANLHRLVDFFTEDQSSKGNPEIVGSLWALWAIRGLYEPP